MRDSIQHRNLFEVEWADAGETRNVDAILPLVRAALMVRVDSTPRTEEVLRCPSVEAIASKCVFTPNEANASDMRGDRNSAAHPAIGAGATADRVETVG
jgi:hypothetical protein